MKFRNIIQTTQLHLTLLKLSGRPPLKLVAPFRPAVEYLLPVLGQPIITSVNILCKEMSSAPSVRMSRSSFLKVPFFVFLHALKLRASVMFFYYLRLLLFVLLPMFINVAFMLSPRVLRTASESAYFFPRSPHSSCCRVILCSYHLTSYSDISYQVMVEER